METAENRGHSMTEDAPTWGNGEYDSSISPAPRIRMNHKKQQSDGQTKKEKNDPWWKLLLRWIRRKFGFTAMCCTVLSSYVALSDTWYVRCNGGSDANDGKKTESAFATLGKALSIAQDNDTLILGSGTYKATKFTKILNVVSENGFKNTIIDCSSPSSQWSANATNTPFATSSWGSYFKGITFTGGMYLECGYSSSSIKTTLDHCMVSSFYWTTSCASGYTMSGGIARNCIFVDNYVSGSRGVLDGTYAYNCTIYHTISGYDTAGNARLYNCILYGNTSGRTALGSFSTMPIFYNCHTDDPKFINVSERDFRLSVNSPCRNAGDNNYASDIIYDMAGNSRIAEDRIDIGAYEYIPYFDVTFDVGEHGYITCGETNQTVTNGSRPVIPTVEPSNGWGFVKWSPDPTVGVESNVTYIAQYIHYQCEPINMRPASDSFSNALVEVTLSCDTEDATIYYTIDGSEPSATNGRRYKGPFDIYQTTTVKAIAVKDDWKDSAVASATFTKANAIGPAINMLEVLPDNDKTHPWTVVSDVTHDGVSAVRSGEIQEEESTTLKAVVYGAGQLSFWW